ncbi:hypothetical protein Nepgr_004858 [Nepenthes gracilis]|uniref:non-specific serine/threonine protein kinase n=1 Tax=Nepenthes gracilis TaxID=150966 RepID=A0AAD3S2A6_NEPGR|nr:hypothetical protein Nepgr_004858 [Nepenthes gracilis]
MIVPNVVETFGRLIEESLQKRYVHLCVQIEDKSVESEHLADEDKSVENDHVRNLRVSPINPCTKDGTSIEDYEIINPTNRGAYGHSFFAKIRANGNLFAIKVLKKADMIYKNAVERILAERHILQTTCNPFVVRFFYSLACKENLYLAMKNFNRGDLYSLLRKLSCLAEDMARVYVSEVVLALEYLHSLNMVHRDVKPNDLLIILDGLSKVGLIISTNALSGPSASGNAFLDDGTTDSATRHSSKRELLQKPSVIRIPDDLASERLLGMGRGTTADCWFVGAILFELLVGILPFNADSPQHNFNNNMNQGLHRPKIQEEMSYDTYDLINRLLIGSPAQRPEDERVHGGSNFDEISETSSDSCTGELLSNALNEDGEECGSLANSSGPDLGVKYSSSNSSFKNLSQLASINYDIVVKSAGVQGTMCGFPTVDTNVIDEANDGAPPPISSCPRSWWKIVIPVMEVIHKVVKPKSFPVKGEYPALHRKIGVFVTVFDNSNLTMIQFENLFVWLRGAKSLIWSKWRKQAICRSRHYCLLSGGKKAFSFGHPSVDGVIDRFLAHDNPSPDTGTDQLVETHRNSRVCKFNVQLTLLNNQLEAESKYVEKLIKMREARQGQFWWQAPVEYLGLKELEELKWALEQLKFNVI